MSAPSLRDLLARAVEEKGADYVYPSKIMDEYGECRYFAGDAPSCIVGHVLSHLGEGPNEAIEGSAASMVLDDVLFSDAEIRAADAAQNYQDRGGTWGEALAAFDARLAELS